MKSTEKEITAFCHACRVNEVTYLLEEDVKRLSKQQQVPVSRLELMFHEPDSHEKKLCRVQKSLRDLYGKKACDRITKKACVSPVNFTDEELKMLIHAIEVTNHKKAKYKK